MRESDRAKSRIRSWDVGYLYSQRSREEVFSETQGARRGIKRVGTVRDPGSFYASELPRLVAGSKNG
jgi:hypothetical protein